MATTLPSSTASRHPQRLEDVELRPAKAHLNELETWKRRLGEAIDFAISQSNRTQKEVWVALGHSDPSQLSRWIKGTENASVGALFSIEWLRQPLVIALASLVEGVEMKTVIEVRRIS